MEWRSAGGRGGWGLVVECPFCGSEVSEDLVTYGGTCPKCFAEIPGDEAPTDPGAEVKAAQDRRDRRGRTVRLAVALSLLVALVSCTGVSALGVVLWPDPEVAQMLDFDTFEIPMPEIVSAPTEELASAGTKSPTPAPTPKPGSGGSAATPKPIVAQIPTDNGGAPLVVPVAAAPTGPTTRPRPGGGTLPDGPANPVATGTGAGKAPGLDDLTLGGPRARRDDNTVLSDPDAIRMMIGERLVENIPGLKVCYDRRLKVDPELKGRWVLTFNVQTNGKVSGANARGLERADAELESCITRHVEQNWAFGKVALTQPVSKTLTFR